MAPSPHPQAGSTAPRGEGRGLVYGAKRARRTGEFSVIPAQAGDWAGIAIRDLPPKTFKLPRLWRKSERAGASGCSTLRPAVSLAIDVDSNVCPWSSLRTGETTSSGPLDLATRTVRPRSNPTSVLAVRSGRRRPPGPRGRLRGDRSDRGS